MTTHAITEESISQLVHDFYTKVRADEKLAPIFVNAIGDESHWPPHLQRMVDFWSSVMLKSGRYHGNPFQKHIDLPSFDISLFDRWLALFAETAHELYSQEIANRFVEKSKQIAASLKLGLYHIPRPRRQ